MCDLVAAVKSAAWIDNRRARLRGRLKVDEAVSMTVPRKINLVAGASLHLWMFRFRPTAVAS